MIRQSTAWMLFLFPVGVGLIGVGVHLVRKEVGAMITWPRVDAVVVSSRVVEGSSTGSSRGSGPVYSPGLKLKYTVAGKEYIRDAGMSGWATSSHASSEEIVDKYPPGSHHMVPYNPADPNEVRMQLGGYLDTFSGPLICLVLGFAFVLPGLWRVYVLTFPTGPWITHYPTLRS